MSSEHVITASFLCFTGLFTIILGILIWTGHLKSWFIVPHIPVIAPTAFYNGSMVFLGIAFIALFVWFLTEINVLFLVSCLLMPVTILLAIIQPRWLQPSWYSWLEDNHRDIIPILQQEAQLLRGPTWSRRVATQEGLEQWVEEVRRKRGLM